MKSSLKPKLQEKNFNISIVGSYDQRNYRSRITLRVHLDETGRASFGFLQMRSRALVPFIKCELASFQINFFMKNSRSFHQMKWPVAGFEWKFKRYQLKAKFSLRLPQLRVKHKTWSQS